jgi:hypothetical protein
MALFLDSMDVHTFWAFCPEVPFNPEVGYVDYYSRMIYSDDALGFAFRRLSAFIHVDRAGDHAAGLRMLGQPAPGTKSDVAPSWLVEECTMHSKNEHQRDERTGRRRKGEGQGK